MEDGSIIEAIKVNAPAIVMGTILAAVGVRAITTGVRFSNQGDSNKTYWRMFTEWSRLNDEEDADQAWFNTEILGEASGYVDDNRFAK